MKVKVLKTMKVVEAVEDGYAVFNCGHWFTTYKIAGSNDEWFVDGRGYAYPYTSDSIKRAYEADGFKKKSELDGVYCIDGKPYIEGFNFGGLN